MGKRKFKIVRRKNEERKKQSAQLNPRGRPKKTRLGLISEKHHETVSLLQCLF